MLEIGIHAGNLLMKSGAEVYRVEDTMIRLCKACKEVEMVESYVMATGIMLSIKVNGITYTRICRVRSRNTNLGVIEDVNALSRAVQVEDYTMEMVEERLCEIENAHAYPTWINIIFGALGAGAFAMFFDGNIQEIVLSFFIGFFIRSLMIFLSKTEVNEFINNVLGAGLISLLSLTFHYFLPIASTDTLVISGIMLLIPGLAITNAIRDTMSGDYISASARALEAGVLACAIAIGAGMVLSLGVIL